MSMLLLVLVIAGCGSSGSSSSSGETSSGSGEEAAATGTGEAGEEEASGGSDINVSYLSPQGSSPDQQQVNLGMEKAAKELGWTETELDANASTDKQISDTEIALNRGDAALASWPLDPSAELGIFARAEEEEVPVIGLNSNPENTGLKTTVWYEVQLCEPGGPATVTAERIAELHPHAKVIMVGDHVAESTRELSACFEKAAKKAGLEVLAEAVNEAGSAAEAQKVFEPLLTKYPEVEAVWAFNEESALGASAALLAAGKEIATAEAPEGVILAAAAGAQKTGVEAIETGRLSWTWDTESVAVGYAVVKAMKEALDGKEPGENVVVESKLIDSENAGEYEAPEQRTYTLDDLPIK